MLVSVTLLDGLFPADIDADSYPADGILLAAEQALFYRYDQNKSRPSVQPSCPTANCTWPTYSTLSVCAALGNITDQITFDSNTLLPTLSGNLTLFGTLNVTSPSTTAHKLAGLGDYTIYPAPPRYKWENPDIIPASLSQFVFMYEVGPGSRMFEAVEVIFHYCVNTYNATVASNVPSRPLLSSNLKIVSQVGNYTNFTMTDTAGTEKFNIGQLLTTNGIRFRLPDDITGEWNQLSVGNYGNSYSNKNRLTECIGLNMMGDQTEFNYFRGDQRKWVWNNLQKLTDNMAEAMGES